MPKEIGVETLTHKDAKRLNIPTAEFQSVMADEDKAPVRLAYERRNRDLDPQLVWRGKDAQDETDLIVQAPPLYIQEKVHPKVLIEDLKRETRARASQAPGAAPDLFADFNGLPDKEAATEFYQHAINWNNRMILGDSLAVMASLAEREGLRGQVQCIYFDPPYGIKFNSNFQWSTTSRDVKDGNKDHITREPEQVRAFRDTWRDGIHSYLSYIRDRLTVARDLLHESGSIFVQIGDENLHLIRSLMEEIFGEDNYINTIAVKKKGSTLITESVFDYIVWFGRHSEMLKVRRVLSIRRSPEEDDKFNTIISPAGEMLRVVCMSPDERNNLISSGWEWARVNYPIVSQHPHEDRSKDYNFRGNGKSCGSNRQWSFDNPAGMRRLERADRLYDAGGRSLAGVVFHKDRPAVALNNLWDDVKGEENPIYVVQTTWKVVQRCLLMTTDPGDLVLDPTCGSGTTAYVAEQWGRRWITMDSSRVSLALARARIMGARYPYYLLADSREGQVKEGQITRTPPKDTPTHGDIRQGFVYERVPHITLKSIANNAEIDVLWDKAQETLEPLRGRLNTLLGKSWEEWEIPREAAASWPEEARTVHAQWWEARIRRQKDIDASIAARAESEYLYDRPYVDTSKVRVAGPFTVESLSPHRVLAVDHDDELVDMLEASEGKRAASGESEQADFAAMILENLKAAGVQQAHKENRITFTALTGWPGTFICAEGAFLEGDTPRRAGIFIGPEFGTVSRPDLVAAAREAGDAGFDVLIACAFNFDAHSAEFDKLGRIPVLKARMNPDLHMGTELKSTGAGNLFVVFGEPDIRILPCDDGRIQVKIRGVDIFHPSTGEIESGGPDTIAVWFIDTDYNEESFFVRHAYFLGANDPYKALKTTLKAEVDREAWDSLNSDTSRPFEKPKSGRIAVKVINHLGDEVMKVFGVE
ncbi:site-specific DNA-methyltransferase [Caenispirillum bisanense]|uniref:site-specific DNA-methyltransferase n=1 Tax=Caenispirillum bisanense TaxID=414052 RepID=UPI0031E481B9